jgi:hypothetical protein
VLLPGADEDTATRKNVANTFQRLMKQVKKQQFSCIKLHLFFIITDPGRRLSTADFMTVFTDGNSSKMSLEAESDLILQIGDGHFSRLVHKTLCWNETIASPGGAGLLGKSMM